MAVWLVVVSDAMMMIDLLAAELSSWLQEALKYLALSAIELGLIVVFICFAWSRFDNRLAGFGLKSRNIGRDFAADCHLCPIGGRKVIPNTLPAAQGCIRASAMTLSRSL